MSLSLPLRSPRPGRPCQGPHHQGGFSLVELLLAMGLGLLFCGVVIQSLLGEGQNAQRFTRLLRERANQSRALALVRADLQRATAVAADPERQGSVCGLAGRTAVLQLSTPEGPITYSVGTAPSGIWQGRVLMRCGPAFGLNGQVAAGTAFQSRVVIDGLAASATPWQGCGSLLAPGPGAAPVDLNGSARLPFSACLDPSTQLVALRLEQHFTAGGGSSQRIASEAVAGAG
ncbi:prepilin-type N-terminal cleavage/methylation domain-containing protein [Synechococcus sp. Tobar12-5m-g]|uniref:prepilin-type N-terminal cleavage/methylation domain-containing protein n=1 Tax=unclassified Synechococcus TaxID=2626047 RepID=UPI0020CD92BF|nr:MULTISPECIES: prepilin-type N-terminal cleavage/methylation domain-containing protein [unclassified Synechococcus]MCP9771622.1 prepilin-type N-terminal cleavage/methylation domain-containing protein [Synechococcus sp. Tobar12-5m-g]MCP9872563.1 prepilin-type N-terminal cleavage/methylation domain-containing protein [Synechococcus sp. Cruz CV-v-12]